MLDLDDLEPRSGHRREAEAFREEEVVQVFHGEVRCHLNFEVLGAELDALGGLGGDVVGNYQLRRGVVYEACPRVFKERDRERVAAQVGGEGGGRLRPT